jgi:hypothetical protein
MLFWYNFAVLSRARAAEFRRGFPRETWSQQPALLTNLPDVSRYRVAARYDDAAQWRAAYARITGGRPVPPPSWVSAR